MPASLPAPVHLHQIVYSDETLQQLQPGFIGLDNRANPRPDWYEYWPIRLFLLQTRLEEEAFYGFFSPRFSEKLWIDHRTIRIFVHSVQDVADVVLFSPQPDMGAMFLNVFEQAEFFDPGMIATYEGLLERLGLRCDLAALVMDSRRVSFSNYVVARPAFWRAWLAVNEEMFRIAEDPADPLAAALCAPTRYGGSAQRKAFLQERTTSFLLAETPSLRVRRYNPFRFAWSTEATRDRPLLSILSDALKMAYVDQGDAEYIYAFEAIRREFQTPGSAEAAYVEIVQAASRR